MNFEVGKIYEDRRYGKWKVMALDGPRGQPLLAIRLRDGHVRSFQADGRYFRDRDDSWDLIKEVVSHG